MTPPSSAGHVEKLARFWSSRRKEEVQVRIRYRRAEVDGCQVIRIVQMEEVNRKTFPEVSWPTTY